MTHKTVIREQNTQHNERMLYNVSIKTESTNYLAKPDFFFCLKMISLVVMNYVIQ